MKIMIFGLFQSVDYIPIAHRGVRSTRGVGQYGPGLETHKWIDLAGFLANHNAHIDDLSRKLDKYFQELQP